MRPSEALTIHRAALRRLISRYNVTYPRLYGYLLVDATGSTTLFYSWRTTVRSKTIAGRAGFSVDTQVFAANVEGQIGTLVV